MESADLRFLFCSSSESVASYVVFILSLCVHLSALVKIPYSILLLHMLL